MPDDSTPAAADALKRTVELAHRVRLPVLGVPVQFLTDSASAHESVLEAFGMWEQLAPYPDLIAPDGVQVRIVEDEGKEGAPVRSPMRYHMPDADRVIVHTHGSVGIVDTLRNDAVAYVTPALLADRAHFQYGILEMLTWVLVTAHDRLPVHAAMVARDGLTVLLAGASGAGKSTLAYQALRAGWTLLADDSVYLQTAPRARLWGGPRRLYLPPDAGRWFPDLAEREARIQANGKTKIAVTHTHDWRRHGPPVVEHAAICLLGRASGSASLERISPDTARASLLTDLAPVHDLYGDAPARVLTLLCAGGGWRLTPSARPSDAAPLLEQLARQATTG